MKNCEPLVPVVTISLATILSHIFALMLTWSGIGHRQQERLVVLEVEVLVIELLAVYGFSASAIALREVSTLYHELLDDTVENGALVVQRLARLAGAPLSGAEGAEVLGGLGDDWYWGQCAIR